MVFFDVIGVALIINDKRSVNNHGSWQGVVTVDQVKAGAGFFCQRLGIADQL